MDSIVIGGVAVNGFLVMIIGFFVRRWMNTIDQTRKEDREESNKVLMLHTAEIKAKIETNRTFYQQTYGEIKTSIDKLTDKIGVQNGRIGHLEIELAEQVTVCKERGKAYEALSKKKGAKKKC